MAANEGTRPLVQEVLGRLTADKKPDPERDMLVLAALDGSDAPAGYLEGSAARPRPEEAAAAEEAPTREPLGAYLKSITVEGFRGIGKKLTLDVAPGPGLTLVVGRNGSGKSSFADALELLLTGDTYRWSQRQGLEARLAQPAPQDGGHRGRVLRRGRQANDRRLALEGRRRAGGRRDVRADHGKPRMNVADLGWKPAVLTYRPILSFSCSHGSGVDQRKRRRDE